MKHIFALAALCAAMIAFQANAEPNGDYTTVCQNGEMEKMGDAFFQVTVFEDGIEFAPWESSFSFDATDTTYDLHNDTISIINKTAAVSSEGEETSQLVNAILVFLDNSTKANVTISYGRGLPFVSYELTCVQKSHNE